MSCWTHVAGIIRVDSISRKINFEKLLGKQLKYDSPISDWEEADTYPDKYTPYGSEGGIQYSIWENPDKACMAKYSVSIFGDLRDFYDIDKIKEWFCDVLQAVWVRDAVLSINCDICSQKVIITQNDEVKKPVVFLLTVRS